MIKIWVQRLIGGDLPVWQGWLLNWFIQHHPPVETELVQQESTEEFLRWARSSHHRRQQQERGRPCR